MAAGLAQSAAQAAPEVVEVMPENWGAMRIFLAMETQWRRAGQAGIACGLDYAALPIVAGALAIGLDADLLARLRVLEGAALTALHEGHAARMKAH